MQSDERFTESFVHHRVSNGHGPIKIEQELQQRGVEQDIISTCLYSGSIDWLALAESVRVKKFGEAKPDDYQNKAKQSRFLYSRGFGNAIINQLIK